MREVDASAPAAGGSSLVGTAESLLLSYLKVLGFAFGAYSEVSESGHCLVADTAAIGARFR